MRKSKGKIDLNGSDASHLGNKRNTFIELVFEEHEFISKVLIDLRLTTTKNVGRSQSIKSFASQGRRTIEMNRQKLKTDTLSQLKKDAIRELDLAVTVLRPLLRSCPEIFHEIEQYINLKIEEILLSEDER